MSILDLHTDVTSAAIPRYVKPPPLTPAPTFSLSRLASSPLRGAGEAIAQVGASIAEVVAGYGDVMGRIESGQSLQDRQPDMQSDFGDALRDRGREFRPDPLTAHAAEQVLYGFARGASKVVGGTLVAGPGGAIAAGVEEGMSAADDLAREGVDFQTRVKAGAVQGAGLALAALPLIGKTIPQTAALYLAGGPGGFMAQQALTREILRAGGYQGIAEQYDPLDPVGLTVSTLLPAAFTAVGIRGQRAQRRVPVEVEDAARVVLAAEQRRSTNPDTGPRAADQHEAALTKAEDAMARGDAVQVADVAPVRFTPEQRAENFRAWFEGSKVVDEAGAPMVVYHGTGADFDAHAGPVSVTSLPATADFYAAKFKGEGVREPDAGGNVQPAYVRLENPKLVEPAILQLDRYDPEFVAKAKAEGHDGLAPLGWRPGQPANELVVFDPKQVKSAIGNSGKFDPNSPSLTDPIDTFGTKLEAGAKALQEAAGPDAPAIVARLIGEPTPARAAPDAVQPADVTAPNVPPESPATAAAEASASPAASAEQSAAAGRIAQIEAQFPDLMVRMDGDEKALPLSEFLARAKAEADEMAADAPLMQVAAECALLNG
jgi:hypothetical protein